MTALRCSVSCLTVLLLTLSGCATDRVSPPPAGEKLQPHWGAVSVEYDEESSKYQFSDEYMQSATKFVDEFRLNHPGERIPFRILALSGGGSRGAFGAGVLTGWSETGTRPEFDIVTGISTGALQATAAFLGPEYDRTLKTYIEVTNEDIYTNSGLLALFTRESLYDTAPLRALLEQQLSEEIVDAVAAEHAKGRRLFIGTTNLDANTFTVWDMGEIASSNHPDRLRTFRDVVLASASFPLAFPPVYFPIKTAGGEIYYQMHVDGGVRESVFVYVYLGELQRQIEQLNLDWDEDIDPQIFVLNNGQLFTDREYKPVKNNTLSIAMRSIESLARKNVAASIYYIWSAGLIHGAGIRLAFIPQTYNLSGLDILEFDPEEMRRLYDFGHEQAVNGNAWLVRDPTDNLDELEDMIDIYEMLEPMAPGTVGEQELKKVANPDPNDS